MPDDQPNRAQMAKWVAFGATLAEVRREREHQAAIRDQQPGTALAKLLASSYGTADDPAVQARMLAAADRKAHPNRRKPLDQMSEIERLVATQPKSSSQVVGHHEVPVLTEAPKAAVSKKTSELERMRSVFPTLESGGPGFHHEFEKARARDAREATALVGQLDARRADAEVVAALGKLRSRVEELGRVRDSKGQQQGVLRR